MCSRRLPCVLALVTAAVVLVLPAPASAESRFPGCRDERVLPFKNLFSATLTDLKRVPSVQTAAILGIGGAGALASHPVDRSVSKSFSSSAGLDETFEAGKIVGSLPAQLGAAFATYGLGRAFKNDCVAAVGGELVQAQLVAQVLTYGIKGAVRRSRPEGGGFSFPSGHTTAAFAIGHRAAAALRMEGGVAGVRRRQLRGRVAHPGEAALLERRGVRRRAGRGGRPDGDDARRPQDVDRADCAPTSDRRPASR